MPKINVNITGISMITPSVKSVRIDNIQNMREGVQSVNNVLEGRLAGWQLYGKDSIRNRLTNVCSTIERIEDKLSKIEAILESAYNHYENAEAELKKASNNLVDQSRNSLREFMLAYQSLFGNDAAFSSTHKGSSGRTHGGGGSGSFGNGSGGGGFRGFEGNVSHGGGGRSFGGGGGGGGFRGNEVEFSEEILSSLSSVYDKVKGAINTVPFAIISASHNTGEVLTDVYNNFAKKYDDAIGSIETLSTFRDIIVNGGKASEFTEIMGDAGLPSVLTNIVDYGTSVVNCVNAAVEGNTDAFFENAQEIGISILDDVLAKGNPAISAGINMAVESVESTVEKGIEFLLDPSVNKFGDLVYSSTLKSVYKGATKTAYEIVEGIPVLGEWMTGEYESLSGKSGIEGVIDAQKQLVDMVAEDMGGFNGYLEGVKLMGKGIAKGATNAKNAVVNGFKSIFT